MNWITITAGANIPLTPDDVALVWVTGWGEAVRAHWDDGVWIACDFRYHEILVGVSHYQKIEPPEGVPPGTGIVIYGDD